jgi:hypothetical protein
MSAALEECPGCKVMLPATGGPTHRYIGASPGCWAIYGEVQAGPLGPYGIGPLHRLTVDVYAAQHPGVPSTQAIRSVAGHLVVLHLVLEKGYRLDRVTEILQRFLRDKETLPLVWLDPPSSLGGVTIVDVRNARDHAEHMEIVERWARSAWDAWSPHHETVRAWARGVFGE